MSWHEKRVHDCDAPQETFDLCDECAPRAAALADCVAHHIESPVRHEGDYAYFDQLQSTGVRDAHGFMGWHTVRIALRLEWRNVRDFLGY